MNKEKLLPWVSYQELWRPRKVVINHDMPLIDRFGGAQLLEHIDSRILTRIQRGEYPIERKGKEEVEIAFYYLRNIMSPFIVFSVATNRILKRMRRALPCDIEELIAVAVEFPVLQLDRPIPFWNARFEYGNGFLVPVLTEENGVRVLVAKVIPKSFGGYRWSTDNYFAGVISRRDAPETVETGEEEPE